MKKPSKKYRSITSPSYNVKLMDYWGDCYESIFIILKPFFRNKAGSSFDFENINSNRKNWYNILTTECEPVSWQEIINKSNFCHYWEIDDGLNLLPDYLENQIRLEKITEALNLHYPTEDLFSPFQIKDIFDSIKNLGYKELVRGPEFPDMDDSEEVLTSGKLHNNLLHTSNIYTKDRKLLFSSAYDMHYSFLCSERKMVEEIVGKYQFEGFFCNAVTTTWWARKNAIIENFEE